MPNFFDDMSRKANELALEADKKIRITKKQNEIGQIRKHVAQQISLLGNTTYLVHQRGAALPDDVEAVCKTIDELNRKITAIEEEIATISQERLQSPTVATASSTASTVLCISCGQPMPAHARFCPHCGAAQEGAQKAMRPCPHCGQLIPESARFCEHCGKPVSELPPEPAPPQPQPTATKTEDESPGIISNESEVWDMKEASVNEDASLRPCPNCSELIPIKAQFCPVCGATIPS